MSNPVTIDLLAKATPVLRLPYRTGSLSNLRLEFYVEPYPAPADPTEYYADEVRALYHPITANELDNLRVVWLYHLTGNANLWVGNHEIYILQVGTHSEPFRYSARDEINKVHTGITCYIAVQFSDGAFRFSPGVDFSFWSR